MYLPGDRVVEVSSKAGVAAPTGKARPSAVRFEEYPEGKSVQILHIGPYDEEGPTIARMHDEFMPTQGLVPRGRHHEIYLSDPRRTDPSRLRTILRQPVSPASRTSPSSLKSS